MGEWRHGLAAHARLAGSRGVVEDALDSHATIAGQWPDRPPSSDSRQHHCSGEKRGEATGPSPTDRGKRGSKQHLLVDAGGIPLVVGLSGANVPDTLTVKAMIDNLPSIAGKVGRPIQRAKKFHADKGYDSASNRSYVRKCGMIPRIARRGIESKERLGRHRWFVERTISWFHGLRRLAVRYERSIHMHFAFMLLAAAYIGWNKLRKLGL
jgi:transposase